MAGTNGLPTGMNALPIEVCYGDIRCLLQSLCKNLQSLHGTGKFSLNQHLDVLMHWRTDLYESSGRSRARLRKTHPPTILSAGGHPAARRLQAKSLNC